MAILFHDKLSNQECSIGSATLYTAALSVIASAVRQGRVRIAQVPGSTPTPSSFAALGRAAMETIMALHGSSVFARRISDSITSVQWAGVNVYMIEPLALSYFGGQRSQEDAGYDVVEPFMKNAIRAMLVLVDGNMSRLDREDAGYEVNIPESSVMTTESFACRPMGSQPQESGAGSILVPLSVAAALWFFFKG